MKVYQVIIHGEEGQIIPGDIFWSKQKAETTIDSIIKENPYCWVSVDEKEIKE